MLGIGLTDSWVVRASLSMVLWCPYTAAGLAMASQPGDKLWFACSWQKWRKLNPRVRLLEQKVVLWEEEERKREDQRSRTKEAVYVFVRGRSAGNTGHRRYFLSSWEG